MPDPDRQNDRQSDRRVADCRRDLGDIATLWRQVAGRSALQARREAEAQVFNQMVVALASRFEDEVPLGDPQVAREVRLLAAGVRAGGWFPEAGSGWRAAGSVTGYRPGDRIALSEEVFTRLSEVFLAQMAQMAGV